MWMTCIMWLWCVCPLSVLRVPSKGWLRTQKSLLPRSNTITITPCFYRPLYCPIHGIAIESWGNAPNNSTYTKPSICNSSSQCTKPIGEKHFQKTFQGAHCSTFHKAKSLLVSLLYKHCICLIANGIFYNNPSPDLLSPILQTQPSLPPSTRICSHCQPNYQASEAWNKPPIPIQESKAAWSFKTALKQDLLDALL